MEFSEEQVVRIAKAIKRKDYCREYTRRRRLANPERTKEENRRWAKMTHDKLRDEMIVAYGSSCQCCGESHKVFLSLHHVNGDGKRHLEEMGHWMTMMRDLRRRSWPKDDYQLLCYNCNMAERYGPCPHKTGEQVG